MARTHANALSTVAVQMHFPLWPCKAARHSDITDGIWPYSAQQTRYNNVTLITPRIMVGAAKLPVLKPRCFPHYICTTKRQLPEASSHTIFALYQVPISTTDAHGSTFISGDLYYLTPPGGVKNVTYNFGRVKM